MVDGLFNGELVTPSAFGNLNILRVVSSLSCQFVIKLNGLYHNFQFSTLTLFTKRCVPVYTTTFHHGVGPACHGHNYSITHAVSKLSRIGITLSCHIKQHDNLGRQLAVTRPKMACL